MSLEEERQEWLNSNQGVIFCGEPWKYTWTEQDVATLNNVLNKFFAEKESETE